MKVLHRTPNSSIQIDPKSLTHPNPTVSTQNHSISSIPNRQFQNRLTVPRVIRAKSPLVLHSDLSEKQSITVRKRKYPQSNTNRQIYVDTSRARSNGPVLKMCLEMLGWKDCPNGREDARPCDIYWHAFVYNDMKDIKCGRVNKFPGMADLAKKISLTRALTAMQKLFPNQYDFYPRSWFIPAQLHEFYEDHYASSFLTKNDQQPTNRWFIAKPDDGSQGENIYLFQNPSELQNLNQAQIIQQYVAEPFLMQDRLKFDLRIYAVIRSLNPLTIYIAREGMARFCTQEYRTPSAGNATRSFMHLTNYSLNKQNQDGFVHSKNTSEQGSKRLLSSVFHQMEARGVDTRKIWHDIKTIIVKTVLALVPELILRYENQYYGENGPQCFHILGFDIILDKDLRPILLEINACPSLSIGHEDQENNPSGVSVVDEAIKVPLVKDTLRLVMDQLPDQRRPVQFDQRYLSGSGSGQRLEPSIANGKKQGVDDSELAILGQRSCLSEIFPTQFGYACAPLLILDKAAYFFMQCVNIRKSVEMSLNGWRSFVKKCSLNDIINADELDALYAQLCKEWISQYTKGLPFYGFVELLMILASRKFTKANCLLDALRLFFQYCESQIRYHGVRSSRLRADAVQDSIHRQVKDFYLLPYHRKPWSGSIKRRSSSSISLPRIV